MLTNVAEPQSVRPFSSLDGADKPYSHSSGKTVSSASLYRLASIAGVGSSLVLLVNAAKRATLIPINDLTQLVAPLAEVMALGLVLGLFMAFGRRAGLFGAIAFVINFIALACLEGVEVVINLVFAKLPPETIMELRAGPLGLMLTAISMLFLVGSIAFAISMVKARGVPCIPLALYAVSSVPIAFRAFVPELVLDLGLVTLAAAIAWLAGWLWVDTRFDDLPPKVVIAATAR